MEVLFDEEEEMLKRNARQVLEAECPPQLARDMETDDLGFPPDLWKKIADLGWLGLALPEQYGGQALPLTYLGIVTEELGRAIAPVPFHCTMVAALTIVADGAEAQRQEVLPRVSRGDLVLTWAVTERDPRLRPEGVHLEAVEEGDYFVLRGMKLFVENFTAADQCLVACRTRPGSTGAEGISLLLVDTRSVGITGTLLPNIAKDKQSEVTFDGVRVPRANLVGELHRGWPAVQQMLERATALLCAQMTGATRKTLELAVEYAKVRVAFGRPIGAFQSISHMCADMVIWMDGCHLLTYEALWRLGHGLPAGTEVSQAKAFCSEKCLAVTRNANIVHGGIAFTREFDLNLWFRRASAWATRLGSAFEHRARVAEAIL
jgi:alkylation response protein AidB-like acyl-CoA dehydrogenase